MHAAHDISIARVASYASDSAVSMSDAARSSRSEQLQVVRRHTACRERPGFVSACNASRGAKRLRMNSGPQPCGCGEILASGS
eukprot:6381510-Pyramimonas_sp.AAC.1